MSQDLTINDDKFMKISLVDLVASQDAKASRSTDENEGRGSA